MQLKPSSHERTDALSWSIVPAFRFYGITSLTLFGGYGTMVLGIFALALLSSTTDWLGCLVIVVDWLIAEYCILVLPFKGKRPHASASREGVTIRVDRIFNSRLARVLYSGGQRGYVPLRSAIFYLESEKLSWSDINRVVTVRKDLLYHVRVTSAGRKGRVVYASYTKKKALDLQHQLNRMKQTYKVDKT